MLSNFDKDWGDDANLVPWFTIYAYVLWNLWINRCEVAHGSEGKKVFILVSRCWVSLHEYMSCLSLGPDYMKMKKDVLVAWDFPEQGWMTFNADGSLWSNGNATSGGVMRDASGIWIVGFSHNLGHTTITDAKLIAIFDEVCIVRRFGISHMLIEFDSKAVVDMITEGVNNEHPHARLVNRIRLEFLSSSWNCRHIFREANDVADWFANHAYSLPKGIHEICSCLPGCRSLFLADMNGVCFTRFVST